MALYVITRTLYSRETLGSLGIKLFRHWSIMVVLLLALGMLAHNLVSGNAFTFCIGGSALPELKLGKVSTENYLALVLSTLIVIGHSLTEEIVFRGFLFNLFLQNMRPSRLRGIIAAGIVGIMFGLFHLNAGGIALCLLAIPFSLWLSLLRTLSEGSIFPCIAFHCGWNLFFIQIIAEGMV